MNSIPKGYKKTEVGMIPDDWEIKKLGDFSSFQNGIGFPIRYQGKQNGDLPFCKVSDMNLVGNEVYITRSNNYISYEEACIMNAPIVPHNSIIFAKVGAALLLNRRRIAKCKICVDNNMMALIPDKCVNLYFIYQKLITIDFADYSQEGALPSINSSQISKISIAVPPLPEQKAIAEVLSDMDALIEAQKELIAKKRDIKQGTMQELLSGRVRLPGYETKGWKHTDIGEIPDDWEVKILGDICEKVIGGGTPSRNNKIYWDGKIPWATVKDLSSFNANSTQEYITEEGLRESPSTLVPAGMIIIATRMLIGQPVIYNCDVAINQDLKALFLIRGYDKYYLSYCLKLMSKKLISASSGSTVLGISTSDLKALCLTFPSLPEQKAIAQVLSDMDNEIETLEAELEKLNHMKRGMMQELLTGRIRLV